MDSTLKDIFHAQLSILDSTQKLAVGGSGDYATLPDQVCTTATWLSTILANSYLIYSVRRLHHICGQVHGRRKVLVTG